MRKVSNNFDNTAFTGCACDSHELKYAIYHVDYIVIRHGNLPDRIGLENQNITLRIAMGNHPHLPYKQIECAIY